MQAASINRISRVAVTALAAVGIWALLAPTPAPAAKTVHIKGKAYRFNQMDTFLAGATIRVREDPDITAVTDANGDYELEVPDDANVTPYIDPDADHNEIDLQTFHTRGRDIRNANFQTPADFEYGALAALLGIELDATGRPPQCVIVTTVSARNVRRVPYEVFHARTPHGVAGATARTIPALPGPIYFNDSVIPDPSQTESSGDGGIVWSVVPAGTYRIVAEHPTTRFASFLATCAPGRVINANPPWGTYELGFGERALKSGSVAAPKPEVEVAGPGKRGRKVVVRVDAAEALSVDLTLRKAKERVGRRRDKRIGAGLSSINLPVKREVGRGKARVEISLEDASGGSVSSKRRVKLPGRNG